MEVIEAGAPIRPPRRRLRAALAALAVVAAILAAVAAVADGREHDRERRAVRACAAGVTSAVEHAQGRVTSIIRYVQPALGEGSPEPVRADMFRLVREAAGTGAAALTERRAVCTAVRARPWHDDIPPARDAWLAYLDAVHDQLAGVASGQSGLRSPRPDLVDLRTQAESLTPPPPRSP